jgi:hypothetical protein
MLARALLCLALLLGATAPAPGAAAGPDDPCPVRTEGPWTVIPTPGPPAGAATVFAVDPYVPSRLFASDGRKVWRSADGGCRWRVVFDVASASSTLDLPGTSEVTRVVAVTVPPSPTRNLVYLLLYGHRDATRTNDRPAVVRSLNGGQDWESVNRGLPDGVPPPGTEAAAPERAEDDRCTDQQGCGLLAGAGDPSALYLFSRPAGPGPAEIDVARPDGTWERRTGPSSAPGQIGGTNADPNPGGSNRIAALRTDPLTAEELWALLEDGSLHRSTDGARSWTAVPRPAGTRPALLDLFHAPGRPAALLLLDGSGPRPRRLVSTDGGRSFAVSAAVGLDELPASIVHGPAPAAVVVAGARGAAGYDETGSRFVDLDPGKVAGPLDSASVSRTAVPLYGFRGRGRLVTFRPDGGAQAGTAPRTPRTAGRDDGGNALTPSTTRLDLAAGASATLTATLTLAGRRLPLDLFFLQDTSASMRSYVAGFDRGVQQLVDGLMAAGIDVAAGLGEFYGLDLRYRRLRDVGPIDDEFRKAVAAVRTHERTGPYNADDQPNLTALHQMATGAGVVRPSEGEPVAPGQQATFRPGAVRVVIHAADEDFAFDPSGPDQATTIAALHRAGVLHAGIHIVRVGEYPRLGEHLEDLSRGTGAIAPAAGLDCDGDGRPDIAPGAPLVCRLRDDRSSVTSLDLATPLTAMLSGVVQEGTATLTAAAPEVGATGLGLVVSERYPGLDLGRSQRLPFSVTVTCPRRPAATEHAVTLVGRVQEAAVADSAVAVRCAAAPMAAAAAAVVPPSPGAPNPPATLAAPPALPGGTAPVLSVPSVASASAPAPASVAQVAPASHPAAQAVAAVVPQQAPALAEQDAGDYAFSRLRSTGPRRRWSPEGPPVAALAALSLATGVALRRRTAAAVVPHMPRRSS